MHSGGAASRRLSATNTSGDSAPPPGYDQGLLHAALHYGFAGGVVRLEVGADFYRDRVEAAADPEPVVTTGNYLIPFAHFDFNLGTPGLKPFLEVDGGVSDNSLRSLMRKNPYAAPQWLDKSSVDYCGRFGLGGSLWRNRFGYRLYAGVTIHDNRLYWAAYRELSGRRRGRHGGGVSGGVLAAHGPSDRHFVQRRGGIPPAERADVRSGRARLSLQRRGGLE